VYSFKETGFCESLAEKRRSSHAYCEYFHREIQLMELNRRRYAWRNDKCLFKKITKWVAALHASADLHPRRCVDCRGWYPYEQLSTYRHGNLQNVICWSEFYGSVKWFSVPLGNIWKRCNCEPWIFGDYISFLKMTLIEFRNGKIR